MAQRRKAQIYLAGHTRCDLSAVPQLPLTPRQIAELDTAPDVVQEIVTEMIYAITPQIRQHRTCSGAAGYCVSELARCELLLARVAKRRPRRIGDL